MAMMNSFTTEFAVVCNLKDLDLESISVNLGLSIIWR